MNNISFSIIINTYNRGKYLEDAIRGLLQLNYTNYEIIIINGPSTDNSQEVIDSWSNKIKFSTIPDRNLSISRNAGINLADGEIIAFIDDDAVPHPEWLNKLANNYLDSCVGGVGGFTIDNTGSRFQVKKSICDRYGNARNPDSSLDEKLFCFKNSPLYPSILGTNCSYRKSAILDIGGFDHTFAYLLDETDVCLRLIDSNYLIKYEPEALVFHQYAESHIRSPKKIPKTLFPSAVSKSYFILTHGAKHNFQKSTIELKKYEDEILECNKWLYENGEISRFHYNFLNNDLIKGIAAGKQKASIKNSTKSNKGDLKLTKRKQAFKKLTKKDSLCVFLISQSFPPDNDAGIAKWTQTLAQGLSDLGHNVHILTKGSEKSSVFKDKIWVHKLPDKVNQESEFLSDKYKCPAGLVGWLQAVRSAVISLSSFNPDIISFPIWDVEGLFLLEDIVDKYNIILSLHTTAALAKPFKKAWNTSPIYEHFHVNKVIQNEKYCLEKIPHILANSNSIVVDIEDKYNIKISEKTKIIPHGTVDPYLCELETEFDDYNLNNIFKKDKINISFVGRFEERKGFDIAVQAFNNLLGRDDITINLVGDDLTHISDYDDNVKNLVNSQIVNFLGFASRNDLYKIYINSDIIIIPSRYESFGLVAIEAMAAESCVIALDMYGLAEVIDNNNDGILIKNDTNSGRGFSECILNLLKNKNKIEIFKKNARTSFLEKYSTKLMCEKISSFYYEIVKNKNSSSSNSNPIGQQTMTKGVTKINNKPLIINQKEEQNKTFNLNDHNLSKETPAKDEKKTKKQKNKKTKKTKKN